MAYDQTRNHGLTEVEGSIKLLKWWTHDHALKLEEKKLLPLINLNLIPT